MAYVPSYGRAGYLTTPSDEAPDPATQDRSWLEAGKDTAIDIGKGVTGLATDVTGLGRDFAGEGGAWSKADEIAKTADDWLSKQYSPVGEAIATGKQGFMDRPIASTVHTLAGVVPFVAGALLAPEVEIPAAVTALGARGLFSGMSWAESRKAVREVADKTPIEEMQKSEKFRQALADNNGDEKAARNDFYHASLDPLAQLFAAGTGAVAGGPIAGGLARGAGLGARAALGAGEFGIGMGGQTAAGGYATEQAKTKMGLQDRINWANVVDPAVQSVLSSALPGAILGAVHRQPAAIDTTPKVVPPDVETALTAKTQPQLALPPPGPDNRPAPGTPPGPATPPVIAGRGDPGTIMSMRNDPANRPPPGAPPPPAGGEPPPVPPTGPAPTPGAAAPTGIPPAAPALAAEVTRPGNIAAPPLVDPAAHEATRQALAEEYARLGDSAQSNPDFVQRVQAWQADNERLQAQPATPATPATPAAETVTPVGKGKQAAQEGAAKGRKRKAPAEAPEAAPTEEAPVQPLQAEPEAPAEPAKPAGGEMPLAEGAATPREGPAVEQPAERPPKVDPDATLVGHNAAGRQVWERPDGRRQVVGENGQVLSETKGALKKQRVAEFEPTRQAKTFDIQPPAERVAERGATMDKIVANIRAFQNLLSRATEKLRWEKVKGREREIVEGHEALNLADRNTLEGNEQRKFDRLLERTERNQVAQAVVKNYVDGTPDELTSINARANNPDATIEQRARALYQLNQYLRDLRGTTQEMYNWQADQIRAKYNREPSKAVSLRVEGGRPGREHVGLYHNILKRASTVYDNTRNLLRDMGFDPDRPESEWQPRPDAASKRGLLSLRADEIWSLDRAMRDGPEAIEAHAAMRKGYNEETTAKRRGQELKEGDEGGFTPPTQEAAAERVFAEQAEAKTDTGEELAHEQPEPLPKSEDEQEREELEYRTDLFRENKRTPGGSRPRVPLLDVERAKAAEPGRALKGAELKRRIKELQKREKGTPIVSAAEIERRTKEAIEAKKRPAEPARPTTEERAGVEGGFKEKPLFAKPVRRRNDPDLSDDHLDLLRKRDPETARVIDDVQNRPLDPNANRDAIEAIMRSADKLNGDEPGDLPLADALAKYLRQMVDNQKKGLIYGRDVVSLSDKGLADLFAEHPEYFETQLSAGKIIDLILARTPRTANAGLRSLFLARFRNAVHDTPVTVLSPEGYKRYASENFQLEGTAGLFNPETGHIVVNREFLDDSQANEIIGHEIAHAASWRALHTDPVLREGMGKLLTFVTDHARERGYNLKDRKLYGIENIHEFMAEAWNNPDFQDHLSKVNMTADEWRSLGLEPYAPPATRNVWRALVNLLSRALGYGKFNRTALEAVMQMTDRIPTEHQGNWRNTTEGHVIHQEFEDVPILPTRRRADGTGDHEETSPKTLLNRMTEGTTARRGVLGLHTFHDLTRRGEQAFQAVTRPIYEAVAKIAETRKGILDQYKIRPLLERLEKFERQDKPRKDGDTFRQLLTDTTMHEAYPDVGLNDPKNAHIGTGLEDEQTRLQHPSFQKRYNELVRGKPEAEKLWNDLLGTARKMGVNDINSQVVGHYFQGMGDKPELATAKTKLLMREARTPAEQALIDAAETADPDLFKRTMSEARATPDFRRTPGPYSPLMRHGNFVVRGTYDLTKHVERFGGKLLDNAKTAVFGTEDQARRYIKGVTDELGLAQQSAERKIYEKGADEPVSRADQPSTAQELDDLKTTDPAEAAKYEVRHQVTMNPEHFETYDRRGDAAKRIDQLRKHAADNKVPLQVRDVERLRDPASGNVSAQHMSQELGRIVGRFRNSAHFQNLPEGMQSDVMRAFEDAAARSKIRSAASARFLPRQLTKGASTDLLRNYTEFFVSTANYMARAKHQFELDQTTKAAQKYVQDYQYGGGHELRQGVMDEITRRVNSRPQVWNDNVVGHAISRVLGMSYLDKLMSPGFLAVNSTEPMMLGIPMIGMRHGGMRAAGALMKAYRDLGGLTMLKQGGADFMKAMRGRDVGFQWIDYLKNQLKDENEKALLQHLADRGWFSQSAEMEIEKQFGPSPSRAGRVLDHADNSFRQLNTAVENLNRGVTALAAYRLERARKNASHEEAMNYAQEKLGETAGNYSAYNAPPVFNHPLGRLALQFKKYPQRVIGNYIRLMAGALKGEGEARREALHGLLLATVTQTLVAGALGLPTEPLKAVFTAGNILGLTPSWDEEEHNARAFMTRHFGATAGEIFMRGLPRYAGIDAGRLGHDSLVTFGTPPSNKPQDLKASAFNLIAGAPGGLAADWIQALQDSASAAKLYHDGATEQADQKALEVGRNILPMKVGADVIDAYLRATKSRFTTMPSGAERQPLYGVGDQLIRGLGFTPGWEAETGEARRYAQAEKQVQQQSRTATMKELVGMPPGSRNAFLQEYNRDRPDDQKITLGQVIKAQAQAGRQSRTPASNLGVQFGKHDRTLRDSYDVYNLPVH
jgi:hypothetical protein